MTVLHSLKVNLAMDRQALAKCKMIVKSQVQFVPTFTGLPHLFCPCSSQHLFAVLSICSVKMENSSPQKNQGEMRGVSTDTPFGVSQVILWWCSRFIHIPSNSVSFTYSNFRSDILIPTLKTVLDFLLRRSLFTFLQNGTVFS